MQQHLPLAVCGAECEAAEEQSDDGVRTSQVSERSEDKIKVTKQQHLPFTVLKLSWVFKVHFAFHSLLQPYLPFAVCAEVCEAAEEQSDDEVRTSQVPEQSEGKTNVMRQQYLPFTVLKLDTFQHVADRVKSYNSTYCLRY